MVCLFLGRLEEGVPNWVILLEEKCNLDRTKILNFSWRTNIVIRGANKNARVPRPLAFLLHLFLRQLSEQSECNFFF